MKLTNVEHINISDSYNIFTDSGDFVLTVTMQPQIEKEPVMTVTTKEGKEVSPDIQNNVVELFLAAGSGDSPASS